MALTPKEERQLLLDLVSGRISKAEYDEIRAYQEFRDKRTKSGYTAPALTESEKRLFQRANSGRNTQPTVNDQGVIDVSDIDTTTRSQGIVDRFGTPPQDLPPSGPSAVTAGPSTSDYVDDRPPPDEQEKEYYSQVVSGDNGQNDNGSTETVTSTPTAMKYNLLGQLGPEGQTNPDAPEGGAYVYDTPPGQGDNLGLDASGQPILAPVDDGGNGSGSGNGSGNGDGGDDTTTSTTTGFANSQIWEYNGQKYVVWQIPNTMMFMRYIATDSELDQLFSGRQRPNTVTPSDTLWTSSVYFGNVYELSDSVITGGESPFFGFVDNFDKATKGRPWLIDDDEMFALWVEGYVEDRDISEEEWGETSWFNNATKEERDWLVLSKGRGVGDADFPADAQRKLEQDAIYYRNLMKSKGIANADTIKDANGVTFSEWFANQVTFGTFDVTTAADQINGLADSTSGITIDDSITNWLQGKGEVSQTRRGYASARNLALKWLGPVYGALDDETLARYAGIIRNAENPDVGAELLQEELKAQRKVLFSTDIYDENLTYEQIAAPWLNYSTRVLGERIDEKSEHWLNILLKNDQVEADKEITAYGLNNNIAKVLDDLSDEVATSVGVSDSGVQRGFST